MKQCYICKREFNSFTPYKHSYSDTYKSFQVIGSDLENYGCPVCGCNDRERHLFMYFDKLGFWNAFHGASVLHFAPELPLYKMLKRSNTIPSLYYPCDIEPDLFDFHVNWTDIYDIRLFGGNSFDFIIVNHVLEHINFVRAAIKEMARVLKPGGTIIAQTPFSRVLPVNFELCDIETDELRTYFYGEPHHYLVYCYKYLIVDFVKYGFKFRVYRHDKYLSGTEKLSGVNPKEDLLTFEKRGDE
ncbi:hypothetical protein LCGC14_0903690 [marine sediment metagenome]|uniref:Methyltransferase type 11 domain-containing protein n=1 Tax=marine sediment metagenome TaxID=412755 RepID=A0A0F9P0C1_9ZZZZ